MTPEQIRERRFELEDEKRSAESKYWESLNMIDRSIWSLQQSCSHAEKYGVTTYGQHTNKTEYTCIDCGKKL